MVLRHESRSAAIGLGQVMLASGLWATVGVSTKLVTAAGSVPQEVLSLTRLAIGGPALLLFFVFISRRSLSGIVALNPGWLAGFVLGCSVFQLCLFHAFVLLEVTTTVFITVCLPPLIATALSLVRADQTLTPGNLTALALGIAGLATFTVDGFSSGFDGPRLLGLGLAVLASVAFVVMTSAARHLTRTHSPVLVAGTGLTLSALVLCLVLSLVSFDTARTTPADPWELTAFVFYLGLGPTALAYVLYCSGMARCRSETAGLVASMVEPAIAALLAWAVLSERLSIPELAGCALVMVAMLTLFESERVHLTGTSAPQAVKAANS